MPIYEFECLKCRKRFASLVLSRERLSEVRCKACGAAELERLWSRFSSPRSEESRLDSLADPASLGGLDESDPQSALRLMKKMGSEMGEDLGDDFEQAMEQEMAGGGAPPGPAGDDDAGPAGPGASSDEL